MGLPDYLVIGHISKDLVADGFTIGGTVTYAAVTARNLGKQTAIVTSAEVDLVLPSIFEGIQVARSSASATTTFRNIYTSRGREQIVSALAGPIGPDAIPAEWRRAPLVHLGPLAGEIDEGLVQQFPGSWVIATPQGWFRRWDEGGRISLGEWPGAGRLLPYLTALVLSDEDVKGDASLIKHYAKRVRTLAVTRGARGATVYHAGQVRDFPARPALEVDPTGAGDVFAAAFLIRLHETAQTPWGIDPWSAARFANVVASFSVEGPGVTTVPNREQVEAYLAQMD